MISARGTSPAGIDVERLTFEFRSLSVREDDGESATRPRGMAALPEKEPANMYHVPTSIMY
jgi:hypothetical protein